MPAPRNRPLCALRDVEPARFRATVRAALLATGSRERAAVALSVGRATLFRWLSADPALAEGIPPARGGRRPGTKKAA